MFVYTQIIFLLNWYISLYILPSMKRNQRANKIPRLFKLKPELDKVLRKHSANTNINQTRLVELALENYFAVKR